MIPLKDTNRSRTFPFITVILIVANGLVFLYELSLGQRSLSRFSSRSVSCPRSFWMPTTGSQQVW